MPTVGEIYGILRLQGGEQFVNKFKSVTGRVRKELFTIKNAVAGMGLTYLGNKLIQASNKQEEAVQRARAAIEQLGGSWDAVGKKLLDLASKRQELTWFGDEDTLRAFALATDAAGDYEEVMRNISLIQDIAAGTGRDLATIAEYVGRAIGGDVNMLARYVPAIRRLNKEQRDWTHVRQILLKTYGGRAEELVKTEAGALKQTANNLGDLVEKGGDLLKKVLMPLVNILNPIVTWLNNTSQSLRNLIAAVIALGIQLKVLAIILSSLSVSMGPGGWLITGLLTLATNFGLFQRATRDARTELQKFRAEVYKMEKSELEKELQNLQTEFNTLQKKVKWDPARAFFPDVEEITPAMRKYAETMQKFNKQFWSDTSSPAGKRLQELNERIKVLKKRLQELNEESIKIPPPDTSKAENGIRKYVNIEKLAQEELDRLQQKRIQRRREHAAMVKQIEMQRMATLFQTEQISYEEYRQFLQKRLEDARGFGTEYINIWAQIQALDYQQQREQLQKLKEMYNSMMQSIAQSAANIGQILADKMLTGAQKIKEIGKQILLAMIEVLEKKLRVAYLTELINSIIDFTSFLRAAPKIALVEAGIAALKSAVMAMAEGGVVTRPTLALIGEGTRFGSYQPEVVAPAQKFEDFARQIVKQVVSPVQNNRKMEVHINNSFSTPLQDKRMAQRMTDEVLKPEIKRSLKKQGRFVNKDVFKK